MNAADKLRVLIMQHGDRIHVQKTKPRRWWHRFGGHPGKESLGWLSIDPDDSYWFVLWGSHENHHQPASVNYRRAVGVDLDKVSGTRVREHGFTGAYEAAVTLHAIRENATCGPDRANSIEAFILGCIDTAYEELSA